MFGTEFIEGFKTEVKKIGSSGKGLPKVYAWLDNLAALMSAHDRTDSLLSLSAVSQAVGQIPAQDAEECEELLDGLKFFIDMEEVRITKIGELERIAEKRMIENEFRVNSGLELYRETFGDPFKVALSQMADTSRWLDGGAGEAKAMIEHLTGKGKGECVATGFKIPVQAAAKVEEATSEFKGRFRYVDGKYFGEMSDMELGGSGFDLITDLNGVLYYTKTLMEDVKRYLQLLNVGGLLVFTNVHIEIDMPNAVSSSGFTPAIGRWMSNIGGVTVRFHEKAGFYEVHKTSAEILVPEIVLNLYETQAKQNDPIRKYSCVHTLPNQVVRAD